MFNNPILDFQKDAFAAKNAETNAKIAAGQTDVAKEMLGEAGDAFDRGVKPWTADANVKDGMITL